jgi:hypothetical protein
MADLRFPYRNTLKETIKWLQNKKPISSLTFKFEDDVFYKSRDLQEAILENKPTGKVECLKIRNFCLDLETHNKCFDFFLRCLEGPSNETKIFFYCSFFPLTLSDAERFAGAITSNGNITALSLMGGRQGFFRKDATFECVFDAILKQGAVRGLQLTLLSFNEIVKRASTRSALANNTTLKELELNIIQPDTSKVDDEGMAELSEVLKRNTGLETIDVCRQMMTNAGRRSLLECLRDNVTLRILNTTRQPLLIDPLEKEDPQERTERLVLQSNIDHHMEWNKLYQRCTNSKGRIPLSAYPRLLSSLANKPLALYLFLKEHNPKMLDSLGSNHPPRPHKRRSLRLLKKRKLSATTTTEASVSRRRILRPIPNLLVNG